MKVMETEDYIYLFKDNSPFTKIKKAAYQEELAILWGDLILEYGEIDGNLGVDNSYQNQKVLHQYENAYITTKAMIRILMFSSPHSANPYVAELAKKTIEDLRKLGYSIDTDSSKAYSKSIYAADKRANHLITRIKMKKAEIKSDQNQDSEKTTRFDFLIASLSAALKFQVPEDITVSRYCEYKKVLNERNKKAS